MRRCCAIIPLLGGKSRDFVGFLEEWVFPLFCFDRAGLPLMLRRYG